MPVLPRLAGQTVRGNQPFALGLEDDLLEHIGVVGLGQAENGICLVELSPARHHLTVRWMGATQHIEAAFGVMPVAFQPGNVWAGRKQGRQPVRGDRRVGHNIRIGPDQDIRFEPERRLSHGGNLVSEAHTILTIIVRAIDESMRATIFGVPRFEFTEPGRQATHHRAAMIGHELLRIKIQRHVSRPEFIEGLDHAATVLLPSRLMAGREDGKAGQWTVGERCLEKEAPFSWVIVFQAE